MNTGSGAYAPPATRDKVKDWILNALKVSTSTSFSLLPFTSDSLFPSRMDIGTSIPLISTVSNPPILILKSYHQLKPGPTTNSTGTEKAVGEAIKASGIPREEIFVTTKLP